jgi:hypothetical protein
MAEFDPDFAQSIPFSMSDIRRWREDFMTTSDGKAVLYGGIVGTGDLAVTQRGAGANMSVDIAAGACYVRGRHAFHQGVYRCYNDAVINKAITGAPLSGARRDIVYAKLYDNAYDASGLNKWEIAVAEGVAGSTPADPMLPLTALPLARVTMAAGDTDVDNADITDLRKQLGFPGSVAVSTSFLEFGNAADYNKKVLNGNLDVSLSGTIQIRTINFSSPFTTTPIILVTVKRWEYFHIAISALTPSQFTIQVKNTPSDAGLGSGTARVYWQAIGS